MLADLGMFPAFTLRSLRLVRTLLLADLALLLALAAGVAVASRHAALLGELRHSGLASLLGAALLLGVAGLGGALVVLRARWRAQQPPAACRVGRLARWRGAAAGGRAGPGRAARWPQVWVVGVPALGAAALAWGLRAQAAPAMVAPGGAAALGAVALAAAFAMLVGERTLAAVPARAFPEAPALRALALVAVLASFAAGLGEIASGLGVPATVTAAAGVALAFAVSAVGVELGARALGRVFLPPPAAELARAAVESVLARLLCDGLRRRGLAEPVRRHLGLDFSRSWALGYVRAAALPLAAGLLLAAWGLSGVVVVPVDARAVYERFGEPRAVLHPGLHLILPWPLGAARGVEYGAIHEMPLGEGAGTAEAVGAEAAAPASADRLWEQPHPGELTLLVASGGAGGGQSFQGVAADLRVLFRVGLDDAAALRFAYAAADPAGLVRVVSRAAAAGWFARRTLGEALGTSRDAMAAGLRGEVQDALDAAGGGAGSGIEVVAVVVEAVHPPAGAADAYHAVRAAEISADAGISAERGRASTIRAQSAQFAAEQRAGAAAAAAETVARARSARIRFAADRDAFAAGGRSFLLERYLAALAASLPRTPMTILDHRLSAPDATVLDLRALPGAAAAAASDGE